MVKKIKLIEDEVTHETLDEQSYQKQMLELQQAMDWKLWEMLKIMQRISHEEVAVDSDTTSTKPIIVDEDT